MSFWLDYIPIWLYLSLLEILIVDEMIASLAVRTNGMLTALVINIPKYICLDTGGEKSIMNYKYFRFIWYLLLWDDTEKFLALPVFQDLTRSIDLTSHW